MGQGAFSSIFFKGPKKRVNGLRLYPFSQFCFFDTKPFKLYKNFVCPCAEVFASYQESLNGFFLRIFEQSCWSQNNSFFGTHCKLGICYCGMLFYYYKQLVHGQIICVLCFILNSFFFIYITGIGGHVETSKNDLWQHDSMLKITFLKHLDTFHCIIR